METVLIAGGSGMVGTPLTEHLVSLGYKVIILSRSKKQSAIANVSYALWNVETKIIDEIAFKEADYLINLAGANVAEKRWTTSRKQEVIGSRVKSGELIVKSLKEIPNKIKCVISASAIGWYGPDTSESRQNGFLEGAEADKHFLGETCRLWEEAIEPVKSLNKRLVKFRIGIVLKKNEGALKEFAKPIRRGIATILGTGNQVISWIHIDDVCRMFASALQNESIKGVYNAVAPQPVSNKDLILTLAKKLRGKFYVPVYVPSFILKIMLGEMSVEVLKSATVNSDKIKREGFTFLYPSLNTALDDLLKK